jgi:hypothetical protein
MFLPGLCNECARRQRLLEEVCNVIISATELQPNPKLPCLAQLAGYGLLPQTSAGALSWIMVARSDCERVIPTTSPARIEFITSLARWHTLRTLNFGSALAMVQRMVRNLR